MKNFLHLDTIVNNHTLNIFTDASVKKEVENTENGPAYYYISAPGAQAYIGDKLIQSSSSVLPFCTNNEGEITAIQYGIHLAKILSKQPELGITTINLFSDSKICIYGLREWIFNWVRSEADGILYGSNGPVKNQSRFISIVNDIISSSLRINFYHVRGHLDTISFKNTRTFKNSFIKENHLQGDVDDRLILFLIHANSSVDNFTRSFLPNGKLIFHSNYKYDLTIQMSRIFNWHEFIQSLDMNKYKSLIGGNM